MRLELPPELLDPARAVGEIDLPGLAPWRRGKVRAVYEAGLDHLVIVASDRLSAYDSVLATPIPGKGVMLSQLSAWWMRTLRGASPHHLVSTEPGEFPAPFAAHADRLRGRAQFVRRARRVDVECVVRGYLTGSGLKEYRQSGTVCGLPLPPGLRDGSKLEPAIFTPATKAESGHDENIPFERVAAIAGGDVAGRLRERSLLLYEEARARAWSRGLVLADTKFEFGFVDGALTLIDEALTPDSSRYWDRAEYEQGRLLSFDKQLVRDWLDRSGWNHEPPAPALPAEVVEQTRRRYLEALRRLGSEAAP
ncbi:MAG TPA: phosphoribosylaminoimidazolesuccinocarboxamide synthase [Terriglobales bacterium]|nr:phosphoribosylaminoimidazolesuccinocarboxamide synthase [Terriglobales bacterium]